MKINKAIVLTIVVLGSLVNNVKNVGASPIIENTNKVSLTDYQLEADFMWANYLELRRQLLLLEMEYPQYIEYVLVENSIPAGLYQAKAGTFNTLDGTAIAEEVANLIEWAEYSRLNSIYFQNKTSNLNLS